MILRHVLFSVLVCALVSVSYAQPDSNKVKGKDTDRQTTQDKRGTKDQPFVIQGIPGTASKEETEKEQKHRADNLDIARRISADLEGLHKEAYRTTLLTLLLFVVAFFQAIFFFLQLRRMRDDTKVAMDSAEAAKSTAAATNAQFHLTHRPKLIVRWIYLIDERKVQFEVTNIGEVGAEILGIHAEVCMGELPAKSPYTAEGDIKGIFSKFIHAGQAHIIEWQVVGDQQVAEFQMQLGWNKAKADRPHADDVKKIYFLGYITYQDEKIHIRHRTAFCRLYDYRKTRFLPMADADPDYEHAD